MPATRNLLPRFTLMSLLAFAWHAPTGAFAAPNFQESIARPLRYEPDRTDFVAIDGQETFNRPLYGSGTPFRVDAGDRPEFSLFLPGRGGVLRLGVKRGENAIWLIDAESVEARYRPGSMIYVIRDPILGEAELQLTVMASFNERDEALLAKVEFRRDVESAVPDGIELIVAFGGATGERGSRNGDIGTEKLPVREFFQLKADHCRENTITLLDDGFVLASKPARLVGVSSPAMQWSIGDATQWSDPVKLLAAGESETPVAVGRLEITSAQPVYLRIERRANDSADGSMPTAADLSASFAASEALREQIANRVRVDTPDPFLNAAMAALNVGAEGTWDSSANAVMHGAVAWRNKLLGWRGAYWLDALGVHDRLPQHMANWFPNQNVEPIAETIPEAEASANLARNEDALHSNGNLTTNHYDMNLVAIDALFRHLLWTGDRDYAKQVWPVIERHLAWERRMFRREFGEEKLPLYEAYASIWASDDLWYNGGGTTHASAYNAYHNRMAARIAKWIGEDPHDYQREADAIEKAMRSHLWLADAGHYAEWRDLLGEGLAHPDAAAWTVYHTIDSQVPTPTEAWQLARYAANALSRFPIIGENVPTGAFQIATTDWFPYQWSTNNVVMAESAHTALSMFQANRTDDAYALLKGAILDSMYLGQCPGNVGMATALDMARSESQRDFADGCGALSRAMIEGLFGIRPDAIAGTLTIEPRFPDNWSEAAIHHPDLDFAFSRSGGVEKYQVASRLPETRRVLLVIPAQTDELPVAMMGERPLDVALLADAVGRPRVSVTIPLDEPLQNISVKWSGTAIMPGKREHRVAIGKSIRLKLEVDAIDAIDDPESVGIDWTPSRNGFLSGTAVGTPGHHTVFARVRQGAMRWIWPIELDVRDPIEITAAPTKTESSIAFHVQNNQRERIDRDVTIRVGKQSFEQRLGLAPGEAATITHPVTTPGTQLVRLSIDGRPLASARVTNWHVPASSDITLEPIDLSDLFNDLVTQIFRNEYLAPRSPYVSLAVPRQGIGTWCKPTRQFDVDDAGLRALAAKDDNTITLPNGVRFATPSDPGSKNVAFVSQWNNYPKSVDVPLTGRAERAYLLMAGSTQSMQSRFDNGEVIVTYTDGSTDRLALRNPETWWPIDQDYAIDDFAFRFDGAVPPRIDLKTGEIRIQTLTEAKGKGRTIEGGAATVLDVPLDETKELRSLEVRAIANEVVIGLMGVTLHRVP